MEERPKTGEEEVKEEGEEKGRPTNFPRDNDDGNDGQEGEKEEEGQEEQGGLSS